MQIMMQPVPLHQSYLMGVPSCLTIHHDVYIIQKRTWYSSYAHFQLSHLICQIATRVYDNFYISQQMIICFIIRTHESKHLCGHGLILLNLVAWCYIYQPPDPSGRVTSFTYDMLQAFETSPLSLSMGLVTCLFSAFDLFI